jgi:NAD+ synthase/NAD+ synthase (glutamine-hydrolysing)
LHRSLWDDWLLLGISGGIDSALTATIAANALGPRNVLGILMPSPFTSNQSITDAQKLASNLKIKTITINIEKIMNSYESSLKHSFRGYRKNVTEQNIQARIRGNLLMALANKYNALVLATGNKSELTVGYSTIYGDMVGGLAPIGDLTKTQVYNLARWYNREEEIIPERILTKAPSAELAPNQKDQDDLPPYDLLDQVLELHIEKQLGAKEIISKGYKIGLVKKVLSMVKKAEFKRRQAPLSLKVTDRAYGSGWRMPIAASQKIF